MRGDQGWREVQRGARHGAAPRVGCLGSSAARGAGYAPCLPTASRPCLPPYPAVGAHQTTLNRLMDWTKVGWSAALGRRRRCTACSCWPLLAAPAPSRCASLAGPALPSPPNPAPPRPRPTPHCTQVAEECGLRRLWSKCIREIVATLSRGRQGVGPRTVSLWRLGTCAGVLLCMAAPHEARGSVVWTSLALGKPNTPKLMSRLPP